jgi:two-component system, chemotaxis family, protein-glutamate methylesterase/glutaminase
MAAARGRVRVIVVDDSAPARAAIADTVAEVDEFELVAALASGEEALDALPYLAPALVLLDIRMKGIDGVETCRRIVQRGLDAVVVLVSALSEPELPAGVDSCGAAAVLDKAEVSPRRLRALWESVQQPAHAA